MGQMQRQWVDYIKSLFLEVRKMKCFEFSDGFCFDSGWFVFLILFGLVVRGFWMAVFAPSEASR